MDHHDLEQPADRTAAARAHHEHLLLRVIPEVARGGPEAESVLVPHPVSWTLSKTWL